MPAAPSAVERGRAAVDRLPKLSSFVATAVAAEYVSVSLGALLFGLIGYAMAWSLPYLLVASLGFAACTWLSRSLIRALCCVFGGLGALASLLAFLSLLIPEFFAFANFGWSVLFAAWWALAFAGAGAYRRAGVAPEYALAQLIGCSISIVFAVFVAIKLDFHSDLFRFLLHAEDNAAWFSVSAGISASDTVTGIFGGLIGPLIPLLLGLLQRAQQAAVPVQTATFAAYTLAIILTPLVATSLLRGLPKKSWIVVTAFSLIVIGWTFHVPAIFYSNFGHLSATWLFLGLLLLISAATFERKSPWSLPVALALTAFIGTTWFPVSPLAGLIAVALCIPFVKSASTGTKIALLLVLVAGAAVLSVQATSLNLKVGSSNTLDTLKGLFNATGGTATIDPTLMLMTLGGTIALAAVASKTAGSLSRLSNLLLIIIGYLASVYALSRILEADAAYGVTKMVFLLMSAAAIALVAVIPHFNIPRRPLAAVVMALALAGFLYAGAGSILVREFPGDPKAQVWSVPISAAVKSQDPKHPRPILCYSSDAANAYQCNRFAGALTTAGDQFIGYRTAVVTGSTDIPKIVADLAKTGRLASSDLVLLDEPTVPWGVAMLHYAGRVFYASGQQRAVPLRKIRLQQKSRAKRRETQQKLR